MNLPISRSWYTVPDTGPYFNLQIRRHDTVQSTVNVGIS